MQGSCRIGPGLLVDAARAVAFDFDGESLQGWAGDTLASAWLANGRHLIARSFKYHRPRGIVTAGPEEPCALVDVIGPQGREPNCLATTLPLYEGLRVRSQNCWPSLAFDLGSINDGLSRLLPAGFYYKTFMAPGWAWERLYEPLIRRAAGFGALQASAGAAHESAQTVHDHTDVLVIGAGPAGLCAALSLAGAGLDLMLLDQDAVAGGGTLQDARWDAWRTRVVAQLARYPKLRFLPRTCVLGAYEHGVFGALEMLHEEAGPRSGALRERLHIIRARAVVLATGAIERLIAFPGNDVPGVMLAGAGLAFLRRFGVAVGQRPLLFTNNDEAYESVFALLQAGVRCAGIVDSRRESAAADRARSLGIEVHAGARVAGVRGRQRVRGAVVEQQDGRTRSHVCIDALLMSGGHTPAGSLSVQMGAPLEWQAEIAAFTPALPGPLACAAGAVCGLSGLAAAAQDGIGASRQLLARWSGAAASAEGSKELSWLQEFPPDVPQSPLEPLWEVPGRGKAFVDLQNDVTTEDVRLAVREGYEHAEHLKRYTTLGMGMDQGRIGGLTGMAVLAQARGVELREVGMTRPRPFVSPAPLAALAGAEVGEHFKPKRRLPLHAWHEQGGARFVNSGWWLRPLVYSREPGWEPVLAEARGVRERVGITDVSSLGKIDVQGPDAAGFLDFIYANTMTTLPVGRARYGLMLREDGMVLDDGTVARLGPRHFLLTTTTLNAATVLEHLEFSWQAYRPRYDLSITDVGDRWAQVAVAGPRARNVVARVAEGLDMSNAAFPFMAVATAKLAGIPGRLFRISFSGELAYELAVPAHHAASLWQALLHAGRDEGIAPYGLDALNTLRIEKGHVTGAELNGNTSACDLGFGRMLKASGDFIGAALAGRPGLNSPGRQQLVAVCPLEVGATLRNGAQLVSHAAPRDSLGFVTSATPSVVRRGWVGLALLADGRRRMGERLIASSPARDEQTPVEVMSPAWFDPGNSRVHA